MYVRRVLDPLAFFRVRIMTTIKLEVHLFSNLIGRIFSLWWWK